MKRNGALVVVGLFIALCGSACANFLLNGIASGSGSSTVMATIRTHAVTGVLVRRAGTGDESLGTFQLRGKVFLSASCTGAGQFVVNLTWHSGGGSDGTQCPQAGFGADFPTHYGRAHIDVSAPSKVSWSVTISETIAK